MKRQAFALLIIVVLGAPLALVACGGGGASSSGTGGSVTGTTVRGPVTVVDTNSRIFTVETNGTRYQFKLLPDSKADINQINERFQSKQEIEVTYKGTTPPYDVVSVK
jgi:ABC-type glycerol-3-phosphate transport system substrate-binding protein